jgi:hypothetical protein
VGKGDCGYMEDQTTRQISVDITPKRHSDESFKDYKERRAYNNNLIRKWLQGRLVWVSEHGTYVRKRDGLLGVARNT